MILLCFSYPHRVSDHKFKFVGAAAQKKRLAALGPAEGLKPLTHLNSLFLIYLNPIDGLGRSAPIYASWVARVTLQVLSIFMLEA